MSQEVEQLSREFLKTATQTEKRMRNIFLGSMALSVLVFLHFIFLSRENTLVQRILVVSFPALFLWSLVITGYAFSTLWKVAEDRKGLLMDQMMTDAMTGLKSLTYMRHLLQNEMDKAIETADPPQLLYLDLESLEVVNRDFGHTVGDIVLKEIAKMVEGRVPTGATVGRLAGDEFIVLMPETDADRAKGVAETVVRSIEDYDLDLGKRGHIDYIGCRPAVMECPRDAASPDEAIAMLQQAVAIEARKRDLQPQTA